MTRGEKVLVTFLSWIVMAPFGGCMVKNDRGNTVSFGQHLQDSIDKLDYSKYSSTSHYAEEQRARVARGEISAEQAQPKSGWVSRHVYVGRQHRSVGAEVSVSGRSGGNATWDRYSRERNREYRRNNRRYNDW